MIPKFRAYSKEENEMYYPHNDKNVNWTIDDETGFIAPLVNLGNGMWGMIDKYELMQSTGLKDKNGVEMFEGDVVLADGVKKIVTFGEQEHEEDFGDLIYYIGFNVYTKMGYSSVIPVEYEVIGNIYENSELLEDDE
ncbi:DNA-packaging protein [Enterococcus faecium]|uniref:YopX family protein n=1 Tax=Enterococcus hirae TaxID=1354 RepID=UPI002DD78FB6|nr:DNA-packaging protein [Enterococcus faecium]EME3544724.1 DNA-packaging protein [Enterococcus faecium]